MDIKNLMLVTSVLAGIGNIAGKAYEDGKLSATDLPEALYGGAVLVPKLIEVDWTLLIPEAKDLSEEEQSELVSHYKTSFDIPQDDMEIKIEDIIEDINLGVQIVKRMIRRFQKAPVNAIAYA